MAIAFVQKASATTTTAAASLDVTITTTAGNTVVVVVGQGSSAIASSVTDDGGSTYVLQSYAGGGTTASTSCWTCLSVQASTTVTVHYAVNQANGPVIVAEYSGVVSIGAYAQPTGSSTTPAAAITQQDTNNFIVSGFSNLNTPAISAPTGNLRATQVSSTVREMVLVDNSMAIISGSTSTGVTLGTSQVWAGASVELRVQQSSPIFFAGWSAVNVGATITISSTTYRTGDTVLVTVALPTTTSVSSITDTGGSTFYLLADKVGASVRSTLYGTLAAISSTSITVNLSNADTSTTDAATAVQYLTTTSFGLTGTASGTSNGPTITVQTSDRHNVVAAGFGMNTAPTVSPTAPAFTEKSQAAGTTREMFLLDVLQGTPTIGNPTVAATLGSSQSWAIAAVELRSRNRMLTLMGMGT